MTPVTRLVTIVEGQGDEAALPVLLRRLAGELGWYPEIGRPIRAPRSHLADPATLARYLQLAYAKAGEGAAVLLLFDADDDLPCELAPRLLRGSELRREVPTRIVLARSEFEAWFLASAESLRGHRGLPNTIDPPQDPEAVRDAKGWLQDRRADGLAYTETADQPALAAVMDIRLARRRSPSFDKLCRELESLAGM